MGMGITSLACLQLSDFVVDEPTVPEALPEVPAEAGETVEEAELEEVADAEVGNRADVWRQLVTARIPVGDLFSPSCQIKRSALRR